MFSTTERGEKMSLFGEIKEKIGKMPTGEVVTVSDFKNIASEKTVSKILERLTGTNCIEKVIRGIFWIPKKDSSPAPLGVANALARANNWSVSPSGEAAVYLFGLSDTPPREWQFVTDGTYRCYHYGEHTLTFCHTSGKLISEMSSQTALLLQVLRFYGKEYMPAALLEKIRLYSDREWKKILAETKNATAWMAQSLRRIRI